MSTAPDMHQRLFRGRPEDALPLTIEHKRIYILPSLRGLAFVVSLLLMLVASINYDLSLGYALCFLLTGLFAAALLHTYQNMAGLRVQSIEAHSCFAGDAAYFDVTLASTRGNSRHGIALDARSLGASTLVHIVNTDKPGEARLRAETERRGPLWLGRLTLSSTWPLGLWRTWSYVHFPVSATVWPAPEQDPPPLPVAPGDDGEGRTQQSIDGDVSGLRDWRADDAPSRVVWKRMAVSDEPKVRLLEAASQPSLSDLTLDTTRLSAREAQLSRLTAWVLASEQQGCDYTLRLPELLLPSGRGTAHRSASLNALAHHGLDAA